MTGGTALSLTLAVLIGLTLGALGGGGAILTLPIFVFVARIPAREAVAMSMVVVGGTSLVGAVLHWWRGNFHAKAAGLFAATGAVGAFGGSFLTHMVSPRALLGIFAALMLVTGIAMVRRRPGRKDRGECRLWPCLAIGAAVGVLTGFLGVGGGFLIVPALVLFAGIETKAAVGSSLAIIALNAVGGLAGQMQQVSLDWWLALSFLGLALVGMFGGLFVAERVPGESLSKAFGWFVIVLAVVIGGLAAAGIRTTSLYNGALKKKPEEPWVHDLLHDMPLSPPYFKRMKQVNKEGPAIIGPELPGLKRWSAQTVYERVGDECLILDTRHKGAFAASHIAHAINIPYGNNLPTWAGWVLPYERPILLVVEHPAQVEEVITHLIRVGFDGVQGYLGGGMDAWETAGLPLVTLSTLSVHDLKRKLDQKDNLTVLDVRTESEWSAGHIDGAIHIHGGKLQERFEDVPRDRPVAVVCGSGYRASIAASFLQRNGYEDVFNVVGGMSAWKAAKLPTV